MATLRKVSVFSASCAYCYDEVIYIVTDEQMPVFSRIDESGDHCPLCASCDFYRQQDLLSAFRRDPQSQQGQPAQRSPREV